MIIESITLVYFSPTKTTKKIVEAIGEGTPLIPGNYVDLTPHMSKTVAYESSSNELMILGSPVYGGRIPEDALSRLKRIKARRTPVVLVVVYGNREYEDALLELNDFAIEAGFKPVAAGAFIGEHSYSNKDSPIAHGRPDRKDIHNAKGFGRRVWEKVADIERINEIQPLYIPGNFPYKKRRERSEDVTPSTIEDLCIKCGVCAEVCPKGAITIENMVSTDASMCIFCSACVKNCPVEARIWEHPRIIRATKWLHCNFNSRKEPETFL